MHVSDQIDYAYAVNSLIFIDTNILLDFYRVRSGGSSLELAYLIEEHKDLIITGDQIEMEYKKNRQRVVLEALNAQKSPDWAGLSPPAFLVDAQPAKMIAKAREEIKTQQAKMKKRIASLLGNPGTNDAVYRTLQKVFENVSPYNLTRDKKVRFEIRRLARKRFVLDYPPRKASDTSIGDAVNWEWMIRCAKESGKGLIMVTRDSDYGAIHEKHFYLNDWLRQEFAERVATRRKIIATERLAEAFKQVSISVSPEAEKEEKERLATVSNDIWLKWNIERNNPPQLTALDRTQVNSD